ncbi:hypothetical protein, partial [Endozoicomonas sp. ONNA1]|uniref:hypothetical protein n=1 Tax=Endozoicomonas sp. ONNA1 TaxID=2828740 RepID=UPI002147DE05
TVLRILAHASEIPDRAVKDNVYSNIIRLSGTKTPVGYSITAALDYLLARGSQKKNCLVSNTVCNTASAGGLGIPEPLIAL